MPVTPQKIYFDIQSNNILLSSGLVPNKNELYPEIKIGQKNTVVNVQVVDGDIATPCTSFPYDCSAQWLTDNDFSNPVYTDFAVGSHWTASGQGTSEYYYIDALTAKPIAVYANSIALVEGTLGSLTVGQWAYGDNDTIGSSKVYVRLADSTDPDTKTAGYIQYINSETYTPLFLMALGDTFNLTNSWFDTETLTYRTPDITEGEISFTLNSNTSDFIDRLGTDSLATPAPWTEIQLLSAGDGYHFQTLKFPFRCANKLLPNPLSPDDPGAAFYNKTESDLKYLIDSKNVVILDSATANIILFSKVNLDACKFAFVFSDTVYENRIEAKIAIESDDSIIPQSIEWNYNDGEQISISYTLDLSGDYVRINITNNSGNTITGDYQIFELADSGLGASTDGFVWLGAWNSETTYNAGEAVSLGGSSYISNVETNLNHTPPNASYWDLLCTGTPVSITANRVAISDGTGAIIASPVTNTEVGYVSGVTSAIQTQIDAKVDENVAITPATKTKIQYDAKGLVLAGTDATTADILDSMNARYVTDSQLVILANTSGINSGDDVSAPASHASQHTDGTDDIQTASAAQKGLMSIAQASALDTATNANTVSTIVKRDSSGNFSAGTITASLTGNASTVTTNANLTGPVTSTGNATAIASGAINANMLQATATDLGAADVTVNLGNSNGTYKTNLTTDGNIALQEGAISATFGLIMSSSSNVGGIDCRLSGTAATKYGITSIISGASTTNQGLYISVTGATNNWGLNIAEVPASATNYAVYSQALAKSYFAGILGLGITSPTAILHIKAGTATAGTSPLKLTSGTLLSSPEAGAIEFLTDSFYATITTGTARKTFAFLEAPSFTTNITTPICNTPQVKTDTSTPTDLTITTGAVKTLVLGTVVYNDANIGALTLRTGGTAPGFVQILDNDGDATGIYTVGFAVAEEGSGVIEVPHGYKEGTNLVFHIHWGANDAPAGGTDNVKWQLIYSVSRTNATFPDSITATAVEVAYTTQYNWLITDVATITGATGGVDGGNIKIGDQVHFTIKRIAASADEFGGEALIATLGFHYQADTIGSRAIGTK